MITTTIRIINITSNIHMMIITEIKKNINDAKNDDINDKSNWTLKRNNTKKHNNKNNNHNNNQHNNNDNDNTMKK